MSERPSSPSSNPDHVLATTGHDVVSDTTTTTATAGFTIDPLGWHDLRAVARLQRLAFRPGLAYGLAALTTLHLLPGVTCFVARDHPSATVIGCVIADRYRGDVRVMNIATHPAHRRKGVARALIAAVATACPAGDMILMVEALNSAARTLYTTLGFVQVGFARDAYGRGRHGLWMKQTRDPEGPARIYT